VGPPRRGGRSPLPAGDGDLLMPVSSGGNDLAPRDGLGACPGFPGVAVRGRVSGASGLLSGFLSSRCRRPLDLDLSGGWQEGVQGEHGNRGAWWALAGGFPGFPCVFDLDFFFAFGWWSVVEPPSRAGRRGFCPGVGTDCIRTLRVCAVLAVSGDATAVCSEIAQGLSPGARTDIAKISRSPIGR
jgi:hypothetical protein